MCFEVFFLKTPFSLISHLNSSSNLTKFQKISRKYLNSLWIRPLFTIIPLNSLLIPQIGKFGLYFWHETVWNRRPRCLISTTHTLNFSFPLLIILLLPSFHHSSSFPSLFSLRSRSNQEGDFEFCPNKVTSVKNLHQGTLIPLILCDRSSFPQNLFLSGFLWTLG